jgi:hypothetical protein
VTTRKLTEKVDEDRHKAIRENVLIEVKKKYHQISNLRIKIGAGEWPKIDFNKSIQDGFIDADLESKIRTEFPQYT